MFESVSLLIFTLLASSLLTGLFRRYALKANMVDIPNPRSSHSMPTPRGGGVAIIIAFLFALLFLNFTDESPVQSMETLWVSGGIVALIGFWDDHLHIAACWRLLAHFTAAFWAIFALGGFPPLNFFGYTLYFGWFGYLLGALFLVWLINLYNFMDGIDGIAGIEAVTVCLGGVLLYFITNTHSLWEEPALLMMASAGFLFWNFPQAKIFMGDAGSGFLGMVLGFIALKAARLSPEFFWSWLILLGVFIVDATWTLLRRFLQGERLYQAHRSHAYQYASRYFDSHKSITLSVGAINLFWLTPLALAVGLKRIDGVSGICISYFPLILLAIKFKAGAKDQAL
ncbi:MAG: MraY family glycosyltransferase [Gammaproteobacteria bacterium]